MTPQILIIIVNLPKVLTSGMIHFSEIVFPVRINSFAKATRREGLNLPEKIRYRPFRKLPHPTSQHHSTAHQRRPENVIEISDSSSLYRTRLFVLQDSHHHSPSDVGCKPLERAAILKPRSNLLSTCSLDYSLRKTTMRLPMTSRTNSESSKPSSFTIDLGILSRKLSHFVPDRIRCKRHVCLIITAGHGLGERFIKSASIIQYHYDSEARNPCWKSCRSGSLQHRDHFLVTPIAIQEMHSSSPDRLSGQRHSFSSKQGNQPANQP